MSAFPKACLIAAHLLVAAPVMAEAAANSSAATPSLPTAFKNTPTNKIKYADLDLLMKQTVLQTGRSNHKSARKPSPVTGTRVLHDNPKPSRLEGNRTMFHQQTEELARVSGVLRDSMLAIPGKVDFATISKNEQLAYWLNLHNIIVYNEIASLYPVTDLRPMFGDCSRKSSVYCTKSYNLDGQMISLKDIRDHVVANWEDPLVIYGFYMGAVGTPNVRANAFTGSRVWGDLRENAVDFIHSVRGTRSRSKKMTVSKYYTAFPKYFPNFDADLINHVRTYAEPAYLNRLTKVQKVKASITDWNIADLYNGHLKDPTGSGNVERRDPRSKKADNAVPLHARRLLADIQKRNNDRAVAAGSQKASDADLAEKGSDRSSD